MARKLTAWGQPAKSGMLARALHELLDGDDDSARALRLNMQIHLARVSNAGGASPAVDDVDMLSTEEAAKLMKCSRPHVAMLIDAGKLAGGVKSRGGHRRVPKQSVLEWVRATQEAAGSDKDYRKAAAEAGMYAVPDEVYVAAARKSRRRAP